EIVASQAGSGRGRGAAGSGRDDPESGSEGAAGLENKADPERDGGGADEWDRLYEEGGALPWGIDEVPGDLSAALAAVPVPGSLLDIGTGLGTVAIHAAEKG